MERLGAWWVHRGRRWVPVLAVLAVTLLALGLCLWLMSQAAASAWLIMAGFVAVGSVLYAVARRRG